MKVEKNTIVTVNYTVTDASTRRIVQQTSDNPEQFLIGHQLLIDVFENQLLGLEVGESFEFKVLPDDAYGPVDPHAIFDLPLSTFEEEDGTIDDDAIQVGNVFPMADRDGNRHFGKIIRKMAESVTMDFNHPLAGKELIFEGQIIAVRKAEHKDLPHEHSCGCHSNDTEIKPSEKSIFEH